MNFALQNWIYILAIHWDHRNRNRSTEQVNIGMSFFMCGSFVLTTIRQTFYCHRVLYSFCFHPHAKHLYAEHVFSFSIHSYSNWHWYWNGAHQ